MGNTHRILFGRWTYYQRGKIKKVLVLDPNNTNRNIIGNNDNIDGIWQQNPMKTNENASSQEDIVFRQTTREPKQALTIGKPVTPRSPYRVIKYKNKNEYAA